MTVLVNNTHKSSGFTRLHDSFFHSFKEKIRACAMNHPDVKSVDSILTRRFGNRVYIEMELSMDGELTLRRSHAAAEQVHADVEAAFPDVKHIMIHVNPADEKR